MRIIVTILFILFSCYGFGQAHPNTPTPKGDWLRQNYSYGEIKDRVSIGKVLLFPTACGAPDSLYATDLGQAAIYFDSCGGTLYKFNPKLHEWSEVGGGGSTLPYNGDTLSYLAGDSILHEFVELKVSDTCCGVSHISNDTLFVVSGSDATDTTSLSNRINLKLNIGDTAAMLNPYLRKIDTASLSNRINLKVNSSDTALMLLPYLRKIDTTAMLSPYLRSNSAAGGDLSGTYPNPTVAKLNGQLPAYYLDRTNHTGFQTASTISDFTTATQTIGDARYPQLSGSYSNPAWITGLAWSKVTSTPTTLSGYGITDAVPTSRTINGTALSSNVTLALASSQFANQGTATTVLHGNAGGNPTWSAVDLGNDVTGTLPSYSITNPLSTKTTSYSVTTTDNIIKADATSGSITITLPTAVGISGQPFTIIKVDNSTNAVIVATTSSQAINGSTTYSLTAKYQTITAVSDNSNWITQNNLPTGATDVVWPAAEVWNGTAPTSLIDHRYSWYKIGRVVTFQFQTSYTTAGATNTTCNLGWPSDLPLPLEQSAITGTNDFIARGSGGLATATSSAGGTPLGSFIKKTGTGTYNIVISSVSGAYKVALATITYISAQ